MMTRCVYCGRPAQSVRFPAVCEYHAWLVRLDHHYDGREAWLDRQRRAPAPFLSSRKGTVT